MSAETEQYREQLGKTFWRGTASHFGDPSDWDDALPNEKAVIADGAMAVAAQVLRDVRDAIKTDTTTWIEEDVERFAADRGINLEGGAA